MSYAHTDEEYKGHSLKIISDEEPSNPRTEGDNFGKMICWHGRYDLGDEHRSDKPNDFMRELAIDVDPRVADVIDYWENGDGWASLSCTPNSVERCEQRVKTAIEKAIEKHVVILPLYLYDHHGITMRCSPFSCPWDSGQVGYIYATREMILKEFGGKVLSKSKRDKAARILEGEVETYDQYLTGDVWGYVVEHDATGWDNSCWGFYGADYCIEEAKRVIDWHVEDMRKKRTEQIKTWIRNRVPLSVRAAALI